MRVQSNENNYASRGVANAGLTTGIIGSTLGGLAALANGNILGTPSRNNADGENTAVSRYESKLNARIAELETEVKLRDANTYTDQKMTEVYRYVDGRIRDIESAVNQQAVYNATNNAVLDCMKSQIAQLQGLTKIVIPDSSVCPQPMRRYNSWEAPSSSSNT